MHAAAPTSWEGEARAAALSLKGLVSHRAAARLWQIDGFATAGVEVVVATGGQRVRHNVAMHKSRQFDLTGATVRNRIPVTGAARTLLDVAAVVGPKQLEMAVDAALGRRVVTWTMLFSVLTRHSARGRNGCGRLRALLDQRYGDESIPDSRWNRMVGHLLIDSDLPPPAYEYEVRDGGRFLARVDLAYPKLCLAIECDSVRFHLNRRSFEADPRRKNRLTNAGWRVLTFTWSDYADRPADLVATVRAALAT